MATDINRYQAISINRLILIIDNHAIDGENLCDPIDCHQFSMAINGVIDIDSNRLVAIFFFVIPKILRKFLYVKKQNKTTMIKKTKRKGRGKKREKKKNNVRPPGRFVTTTPR